MAEQTGQTVSVSVNDVVTIQMSAFGNMSENKSR